MKSWVKALSCAVGVLLCTSTIEAAPLHGDYGPDPQKSRAEWFSELHRQQNVEIPTAFASEQFRSITQGKTVSLSFDNEDGDPLGLFSSGPFGTGDQFYKKWVGFLFGIHTLNVEEEGNSIPISAQSTSAIPLPAGFFLFIGGLGGILLLGRLKRRTKTKAFRKDTFAT